MVVGGIGVALTQATLFGVVAVALPAHRFATGSGILNMSRQIGLALGVAVLVALVGTEPSLHSLPPGLRGDAVASAVAGAAALLLPARPAPARVERMLHPLMLRGRIFSYTNVRVRLERAARNLEA